MRRTIVLIAVLMPVLLSAAELFRCDFETESTGPVRTAGYRSGRVNDLPTSVTGGRPERTRVETAPDDALNRWLVIESPSSGDADPGVLFDGGDGLYSEGAISVSLKVMLLDYRPTSDGGPETIFTVQLAGRHGVNLGNLTYVRLDDDGGRIQWNPPGSPGGEVGRYTIGMPNRLALRLDGAGGAIQVGVDDSPMRSFAFDGDAPFRLLHLRPGWAVGGRDGSSLIAIDDIVISDDAGDVDTPLPTITAGPTVPPGIGEWDGVTMTAELEGPYEDMSQMRIPFGRYSYYLTPWRAYMDTQPAERYTRMPGINWKDHPQEEIAPLLQLLSEAGFHSARVEVNWSAFSFEDENTLLPGELERLRRVIPEMRRYGIRPLLLLNANSGAPCPHRRLILEVAETATAGSRTVRLRADADGLRPGYTGFHGQEYQTAFPMLVRVTPNGDGTVTAELSAPLRRTVPAGPAEFTELKYAPLSGDVFADGTPNPAAWETLEGWRRYVANITGILRDLLASDDPGDAGFDVEVWNEYTFGSQFLDERFYYEPSREFRSRPEYRSAGRVCSDGEILLPLAIDWINDPANHLPWVAVISGFANQRPFDNGTEMWPGQGGFSRHYYTSVNAGDHYSDNGLLSRNTEFPERFRRLVDALGHELSENDSRIFVPEHRVSFPEFWNYGYKTEFMTRDLQPFPGPFPLHHRFSHPGSGRIARQWMTEFNLYRRGFGEFLEQAYDIRRGDPRMVPALQALGAKALLRSFVFLNHKGLDTLYAYATMGLDDEFGLFPESFFPELSRQRHQVNDVTREAAGPQLRALGNAWRILDSGTALEVTRPLGVARLVEHRPRLVFKGNGTPEAPDRFHRHDFAILPFQLDQGSYAVAFYVVTRDLLHGWEPELDLLDPERYNMPEQRFDVEFTNLKGDGAVLEIHDPMTGLHWPATPLDSTGSTLNVALPAVDYPRFLIVRENRPGPLILAPRLETGTLRFSVNMPGEVLVSWGPFPDRQGREWRGAVAAEQEITVPLEGFGDADGVRITFTGEGLTCPWPRWDHDTAGTGIDAGNPADAGLSAGNGFLPELPPAPKPSGWNPAPEMWTADGASFRNGGDLAYLVSGGIDSLMARLPVTAGSDRCAASAVTAGGFPAWEIIYTFDPAAHPDRSVLSESYLIWPLKEGFLVLHSPQNISQRTMDSIIAGINLN